MDDMLDWLKENTNHIFSTYIKSKEGAWISPHTLTGHEDNVIWNNTKLGQSAQRKIQLLLGKLASLKNCYLL